LIICCELVDSSYTLSKVTLNNTSKTFADVHAVRNLTLEIEQGEFFSLLGPSGCGKTTTLRMVAGFEFPTAGRILFADRDVTYLKPNLRKAGMVFQNFALFPHMSVFENVAFGLKVRKLDKEQIQQRVEKALALVHLQGLGNRQITQLSGGQQQRVALARAIVIEPEILLLDEPLSNLDAKLREETRDEIRMLQQRLGITTIYVTHDQEEALTLSDRIAVMQDGVCLQVGTPEQVYREPATPFVANFVGSSNIFHGTLVHENGAARVEFKNGWHVTVKPQNASLKAGQEVAVSLRPEDLRIAEHSESTPDSIQAIIRSVKFSGAVVDYKLEIGSDILRVRELMAQKAFTVNAGSKVGVSIKPEDIRVFAAAE